MRGIMMAAIMSLTGALIVPPTADAGDPGIKAVDAFFRTCMSDASAYDELAATFRADGWHPASDEELAQIDIILGASRAFIGKKDLEAEIDVFASGRHVAVISQTKLEPPLVGCYLYAIGAPGSSAKSALLQRTNIPAPLSNAEQGHYESLKWGPDNGFENHISLKFLHIVPGGLTQKQLGLTGVSLATTIYKR